MPQSAPIPLGPQSLCDETATKSAPSAWTSTTRCGAACAASTTMIAPCSCAQVASASTGLIVPSVFETRLFATTLTLPSRAIPSSASSWSSPWSSIGICRKPAPVRCAMNCHGTKLEWCSSSVITTRSPGPRLSRPQAYATRLIASVALRVKTISFSDGALRNDATVRRAPSNPSVATLREPIDAPMDVRVLVLVERAHPVEHLARLLRRGRGVEERDGLAVDELVEDREVLAQPGRIEHGCNRRCHHGHRSRVPRGLSRAVGQPGFACPFVCARSAIARWRSTEAAAVSRISQSRTSRWCSLVCSSSSSFSSGPSSNRAAIA